MSDYHVAVLTGSFMVSSGCLEVSRHLGEAEGACVVSPFEVGEPDIYDIYKYLHHLGGEVHVAVPEEGNVDTELSDAVKDGVEVGGGFAAYEVYVRNPLLPQTLHYQRKSSAVHHRTVQDILRYVPILAEDTSKRAAGQEDGA